jgi:hypothetical protein
MATGQIKRSLRVVMLIAPCSLERSIGTGQDAHHTCVMACKWGETSMLDRAIATRHADFALDETPDRTTETCAPRNVRPRLRILRRFKERCLRVLRALGEFVSAGGPLS